MNERTFNVVTTAISVAALIMSAAALCLSLSQHYVDYEHAILVQPGTFPITKIIEGKTSFDFDIANTSKSNLQYFFRASTNIGWINGTSERPVFYPSIYESQIIGLSKSDAGKSRLLAVSCGQPEIKLTCNEVGHVDQVLGGSVS
ncbi:MAG: hypothetical protein KKA71_08790, partial [Proteobacteria bacterium]|nr:hypothetical protein [Pseudomonadota bacterium]